MNNEFLKLSSHRLEQITPQQPIENLAQAVIRLSDAYQQGLNGKSLWGDTALTNAYLSYFLPLNWLRLKSVVLEGQRLGFFSGLERIIDFGSGPGTFQFAALDCGLSFKSWDFIEIDSKAQTAHQSLLPKIYPQEEISHCQWSKSQSGSSLDASTLIVASYTLNELENWPSWFEGAEALLLVEPSTGPQSRRLQEYRQRLIEKGFSIWAPCTHQLGCPLLLHSKKDWCHQRIHVELPSYVRKIEAFLPMKNNTLTYSYILARRQPAASTKEIRVIGDTLFERGKIRQAICRGPDREFLSWLTRHGEPETLPRGLRTLVPEPHQLMGNEIRILPTDKSTN